MQSLVLGATPIRDVSRRQLFSTPIAHIISQPFAQSQQQPVAAQQITATTSAGTFIRHIQVDGNQRATQLGTITGTTFTDNTKLDVIWTSDGATESVDPANLEAYNPVATTSTSAQQQQQQTPRTTLEILQPTLQRQYTLTKSKRFWMMSW